MSPDPRLESLLRQARADSPPALDVASRVAARLAAERHFDPLRPMAVVAAVAAVLTLAAAGLALRDWTALGEPLLALIQGASLGVAP